MENQQEHAMVRHEAGIALGNIGSDACIAALKKSLNDPDELVAETAEVALGAIEYWAYWDDLEKKVNSEVGQ